MFDGANKGERQSTVCRLWIVCACGGPVGVRLDTTGNTHNPREGFALSRLNPTGC